MSLYSLKQIGSRNLKDVDVIVAERRSCHWWELVQGLKSPTKEIRWKEERKIKMCSTKWWKVTYTNIYIHGGTYVLVGPYPYMCVCVRRGEMWDPCATRHPDKYNNTHMSSSHGTWLYVAISILCSWRIIITWISSIPIPSFSYVITKNIRSIIGKNSLLENICA